MKSIVKKSGLITLLVIVVLGLITSCGGPSETTTPTETTTPVQTTTPPTTTTTTTAPTSTPTTSVTATTTSPTTSPTTPPTTTPTAIEITDQVDRVITLEKIPDTIISLAPSNTEILFALGLGDKVEGVTQYCDYPAEAEGKTKIGGFSATDIDVSIEQIVEIGPDLILASDTHVAEVVPKLEQFLPETAVVVIMNQTESFDVIYEAIALIGECTGTGEQATQIISEMRDRITAITDVTDTLTEAEKPKVLYVVWPDPIFAIGGGTLGNTLIEAAGGINIYQDTEGAPMTDLETILDRNPDVMLGSLSIGTGMDLAYQFVSTDERLNDVNARLNDQVYAVNDDLYGRPGPRLVEALEELAKWLHPELFQ